MSVLTGTLDRNTARGSVFFTSAKHVFSNVWLSIMKLAWMKIDGHQI